MEHYVQPGRAGQLYSSCSHAQCYSPGDGRRASPQIWTRPLGLAGVWGAMVEDWLDELLPDDADVICRDRVHLLVGAVSRRSAAGRRPNSKTTAACIAPCVSGNYFCFGVRTCLCLLDSIENNWKWFIKQARVHVWGGEIPVLPEVIRSCPQATRLYRQMQPLPPAPGCGRWFRLELCLLQHLNVQG